MGLRRFCRLDLYLLYLWKSPDALQYLPQRQTRSRYLVTVWRMTNTSHTFPGSGWSNHADLLTKDSLLSSGVLGSSWSHELCSQSRAFPKLGRQTARVSTPQVTPHNAEPNLTFRLMSTFRYLAEKPNLKITLIYICLCSDNAFQIRAGNQDTEVGWHFLGEETPFSRAGDCVFLGHWCLGRSSTSLPGRVIPLETSILFDYEVMEFCCRWPAYGLPNLLKVNIISPIKLDAHSQPSMWGNGTPAELGIETQDTGHREGPLDSVTGIPTQVLVCDEPSW